MSNVHPFLQTLTVNRQFINDFMDADAPCFGLGLVEEASRQFGALVLRPGEIIPLAVTRGGFSFGHSLLGGVDYEVIHFAFKFYGLGTYNVLLNPSNPLVQTALRAMIASGNYFFFSVGPDQGVIAFRSQIDDHDLAGLKANLSRILSSRTTEAQYQQTLAQFQKRPTSPGRQLRWVCRDDLSYLDLTRDRFDMSPLPGSSKTAARRGPPRDESANDEVQW